MDRGTVLEVRVRRLLNTQVQAVDHPERALEVRLASLCESAVPPPPTSLLLA